MKESKMELEDDILGIIDGPVDHHILEWVRGITIYKESKIDAKYVALIWHAIAKLAGITNLNRVPQLTDPKHNDVKLILTMYSL